MKIYNSNKIDVVPALKITQEMIDHNVKRTTKHIEDVKKHAKIIATKLPKHKKVVELSDTHDASKFEHPEKDAYHLIAWKYKCKQEGIPCVFNKRQLKSMKDASYHHITHNKHHPEYWVKRREIKANKPESPFIPLDATKMKTENICEMCADWLSMSEELKNDPRDWADKVIGKKYKFTNHQVSTIYEILNECYDG